MRPPRSRPHAFAAARRRAIAVGIAVGIAVAATAGGAACTADLPRLTDHDATIGLPCSPFADLVVEFKPAGGDNDVAGGMAALGPPDDAGVAIALDTVLTVAFVGLGGVPDATGADLGVAVASAPTSDAEVAGYVSADGETYEFAGSLGAEDTTLDLGLLAGTPSATYVRLVGLAGTLTVDSIEAIEASCP